MVKLQQNETDINPRLEKDKIFSISLKVLEGSMLKENMVML